MDLITCFKTFKCVVEQGSLVKAETRLGISSSSISKQIKATEEWAATPLLHRTTRTMVLTDNGRYFYQQIVEILKNIDLLQDTNSKPSDFCGTLRISTLQYCGLFWVLPKLFEFQSKYPGVQVDLMNNYLYQNLINDECDIVINPYPNTSPDVISMELGAMQPTVSGSDAYFKKFGIPKHPDDLVNHNCLVNLQSETPGIWEFLSGKVMVNGNFRSSNFMYLLQGANDGFGLHYWLNLDLKRQDSYSHGMLYKNLRSVLTEYTPPKIKLYMHFYRFRQNRIINALIDHLRIT